MWRGDDLSIFLDWKMVMMVNCHLQMFVKWLQWQLAWSKELAICECTCYKVLVMGVHLTTKHQQKFEISHKINDNLISI